MGQAKRRKLLDPNYGKSFLDEDFVPPEGGIKLRKNYFDEDKYVVPTLNKIMEIYERWSEESPNFNPESSAVFLEERKKKILSILVKFNEQSRIEIVETAISSFEDILKNIADGDYSFLNFLYLIFDGYWQKSKSLVELHDSILTET